MKSRKVRKSLKNKNNKRRTYRKKIKGGCGCSSGGTVIVPPSIFSGGSKKKKIRGGTTLGPASLTDYDKAYNFHYPFDSHNNDPLNPAEIVDTRQLPSFFGGSKRHRKKSKMIKGGGDPVITNYEANSLSNFAIGTTNGSLIGADIVSGRPVTGMSNELTRTDLPFL